MSKIIVDVYGGVGNQIFQYLFAKQLELKGYDVSISNYFNTVDDNKSVFLRKTILHPSTFGFKDTGKILKLLFRILDSRIIRKLDKKKRFVYAVRGFFSWQNDSTFNETQFKYINRITGHWQYFENVIQHKHYIIDSMKNNINEFKPNLIYPQNKVAIHVRRGDYLGLNLNLNDKYYKQSMMALKSMIKNLEFEVFSDDINWVKTNNVFDEAVKFHDYIDGESSNLNDFKNLFKFRNFIISNSTFSLIPAIVNSTYDGYVVYPKNWKDDEIEKIKKDNWIGF